jgi:hypothetical protein
VGARSRIHEDECNCTKSEAGKQRQAPRGLVVAVRPADAAARAVEADGDKSRTEETAEGGADAAASASAPPPIDPAAAAAALTAAIGAEQAAKVGFTTNSDALVIKAVLPTAAPLLSYPRTGR